MTLASDTGVSGAGDIIFQSGGVEMGRIKNPANASYGAGSLIFGNDHNSDYGPDSGTPSATVIPIRFQVLKGTPGVDLGQTHQGGVAWTKYKTRTTDQAAQSWSFGVIFTDAFGAHLGPQTQVVTGNESDCLLQGSVVVNAKAVGHVGSVQVQGTAHADTIINFYSALNTVSGTVTNRYGFFDEGTAGAGTITNSWSFYGRKAIQTEDRLVVGSSANPPTTTRVLFIGSSGDSAGTLAAQQGSGQSAAAFQVRDSGGVQRGQWFGSTGTLLIGNGATAGSGNAILSLCTTANPSGTPPAAGVYFYADTVDNKAKVKTTDGQVTTIQHALLDLLISGLGFKSWNIHPNTTSGSTAPTAGTVYATSVPYRAGQVITNVTWLVGVAAVGAVPTSLVTGIADSTGKIVAQSNELKSSAIWTAGTGIVQAPLSATYTVPADGLYYNVILQVGSWGTTQLALGKGVGNNSAGGIGTVVFGTGGTTAQTALPATNSSIAGGIVATNGISYWTGAS